MTSKGDAEKYKERLKKEKREKYERSRKKAQERQYKIQSEKTKASWDLNEKRSEDWRKKEFQNKSLSYKIRKFFDTFRRDPKPDEGLFSRKEKHRKKRSFFRRIFKKKKKKSS